MKYSVHFPFAEAHASLVDAASDLFFVSPLAMMMRGYGAATKQFSINNVVVDHLQDAAVEHARMLQNFSHETAAIWIEPVPVSPMSAVIKMTQTQKALLRHLETSTQDSIVRFDALQASAQDLIKAD